MSSASGKTATVAAMAQIEILSQLDRNDDGLEILDALFGKDLDPQLRQVRADLAESRVVVVAGFQWADDDDNITTLPDSATPANANVTLTLSSSAGKPRLTDSELSELRRLLEKVREGDTVALPGI